MRRNEIVRYRVMNLICFFDLPVDTGEDRKEYRKFRKELISNGFVMLQYSVYTRTCPNREYSKKFIENIKAVAPKSGNIQIIMVTQKQFNDKISVYGRPSPTEKAMKKSKKGLMSI